LQSTLTFENFYIEERPSFFDFLHSGWKINLSVAVDFTASNGEVSDPTSLHYLSPYLKPNDYQKAIRQVGNILELYDHDRKYPCYGFGGIPRYSGSNVVSHCFHLNGAENPQVDGIEGILESYQFSLLN
jgi:copine 5/8/9